jgi:hypothetical protein
MFRYSRDVKRCGPGTKAGAPVGVVYCLSTSSFFILTLTLELDVSAFGIGDCLATYSRRSASAASTDLWVRHCNPDHCEIAGLCPEDVPRQYSPALQQSLPVPATPTRGVAYQAFLDSIVARASAKLARIRSIMILGASLLDFWTSSTMSLVFLTVASNMRLANSACFVATS